MARPKAVIKQQIINTISGIPIIQQLVVNNSQVAYNNNFIDIVARCVNFLEQLMDVLKGDLEGQIAKGIPGNNAWVQDKVLKFQYDATTPQVTQLIDGVPQYPIINPALRIITRCSSKTTALNSVEIKVAKSEPPVPVSNTELNSLIGYLNQGGDGTVAGSGTGIGFAGIYYDCKTYDSDKLFALLEVVFNGQYATVIQTTVEGAINAYLSGLPFDSIIRVIDIIIAIKNASPGVVDVIITDLAIRADTTPFANQTFLVQAKTELLATFPTFAGYVVGETTPGQTFADTITYTAA